MPLFAAMLLAPSAPVAFVCQGLATIVGAAGGTIGLSALQTYAEPHRRATAVAMMLMLSSLIGLGLGPVAVGQISDLLAATQGKESLRYALLATTLILLWAALHFALASRTARADAVAD
jgi:uncharacterized Tic20 family protein